MEGRNSCLILDRLLITSLSWKKKGISQEESTFEKESKLAFLSYTSDERSNGDHACRKEPRTSPWKTEKCTEDTFLLRSGGKFGDSCEKKDDSQSDILNQKKEQFRREHCHNRLKIGSQHNELWATINELTERFLRSRRKMTKCIRKERLQTKVETLSQQDGYKPWPMSEETKKIIVELGSFSIFSIPKCTWKNRCERCHRYKIKRMPFRTSISWRCQTSRSREAIAW